MASLKAITKGLCTVHSEAEGIDQILKRRWLLSRPDTKIQPVSVSFRGKADGSCTLDNLQFSVFRESSFMEHKRDSSGIFYVIRDDLLHPLMGGNKLRKLDALIPILESASVTDVVTCGGCQSAHAAALAAACAENGLKAHLLLRGEKLDVPTGYNLISGMYGKVTYVSRSSYADREAMLTKHADIIAGSGSVVWLQDMPIDLDHTLDSSSQRSAQEKASSFSQHVKKVAVVQEGASDTIALLGLVRLVDYLAQPCCFGRSRKLQLVVDSGTGTTAIGLAVGILMLGLPWKIIGVTLAGTVKDYEGLGTRLLIGLNDIFNKKGKSEKLSLKTLQNCITWVGRHRPRKFGNVLEGEIQTCQRIAQETGILLDPIYTLAAWEVGCEISSDLDAIQNDQRVVILHTGGTMGLFGLAQRYPDAF